MMKTTTTLLTSTLLTSSLQAAIICTFENLPPPTDASTSWYPHFRSSPISEYEGFHFRSNVYMATTPTYNGIWGYYDLITDSGYEGYDEGIDGDRALFTPWGSSPQNNYTISRDSDWFLHGIDITAVWNPVTVTVKAFNDDALVYAQTTILPDAHRLHFVFSTHFNDPIDRIAIHGQCGTGELSHLAVDNIVYRDIPTPSALALLGVAGLVGRRGRRR